MAGVNGEDSRRPVPWHRPDAWDTTTLARYRALAGVRQAHAALRHGGLRWAHVDDDAVAYLRETGTERILVLARRGSGPALTLPGLGAETLDNIYGGATAHRQPDGTTLLPADGPTLQIWCLR
jgi:alpha-glucosidase